MNDEDKPSLASVGGPSDRVTVTVPVLGVVVEIFDRLASERDTSRGALMSEALEFYIRAHKDAAAADVLTGAPAASGGELPKEAWGLFGDIAMALDLVDDRNMRPDPDPIFWQDSISKVRELVQRLRNKGWAFSRVPDDALKWFDPERPGG